MFGFSSILSRPMSITIDLDQLAKQVGICTMGGLFLGHQHLFIVNVSLQSARCDAHCEGVLLLLERNGGRNGGDKVGEKKRWSEILKGEKKGTEHNIVKGRGMRQQRIARGAIGITLKTQEEIHQDLRQGKKTSHGVKSKVTTASEKVTFFKDKHIIWKQFLLCTGF